MIHFVWYFFTSTYTKGNIMKITCEFCGIEYDDTLEKCPSCDAVNKFVRKSTMKNPTTIEELKKWYKANNLPPYEVTRFFIGCDYKNPRAFGIFKDENTGIVTVYKNKDNGQRAVRYEGTDEAYAVNEILTKLKEEVIIQKQHQAVNKSASTKQKPAVKSAYSVPESKRSIDMRNDAIKRALRNKKTGERVGKIIPIAIVLLIFFIFVGAFTREIRISSGGYYSYNGGYYYRWTSDENYYRYDDEIKDWVYCENNEDMPPEYKSRAKKYYLGYDYIPNDSYTDFMEGKPYCSKYYPMMTGYYDLNGTAYCLIENKDSANYMVLFDNGEWTPVGDEDIPYELTYSIRAENYYLGDEYQDEYYFTDITESDFYKDYILYPKGPEKGYYQSNGSFYYFKNDYETKWYEYDEDENDWIYVEKNEVPEDLWKESSAEDFYYTPDWNSETQISDFDIREEISWSKTFNGDNDSWSSSSSWDDDDDDDWWSSGSSWDDDDDWSWSSDSDWDSGYSDWDSDW